MIRPSTTYLAGLVAGSVLVAAYEALAYWREVESTSAVAAAWPVVFLLILVLWIIEDSKAFPAIQKPFEYGFLVFMPSMLRADFWTRKRNNIEVAVQIRKNSNHGSKLPIRRLDYTVIFARQPIVLLLGAVLCATSSAATSYRLERCAQFNDGVVLKFIGSHREVRRLVLGPRGVELSGDVKGSGSLVQVRELALMPVFKIVYVSGDIVRFGPIDAPCQKLLQQVAGPLMRVRDTEAKLKR
jgi:hypothetical protein